MRLVDADVLKVKQQKDADLFIGDDTLSGKSRRDEALNAVANIVNAPTVDAVEVVRCKDCKKYVPCQKLPIGTSKWCDLFDRATCEMNYCGWGEKERR